MAYKLGREAFSGPRMHGIYVALLCLFTPAIALAQAATDRTQAQAVAAHVVQAGDVLGVLIFGWPNPTERLEGKFPVEANGKVHLPVVGAVDVAGKTTERVQAELRQRLASEQNQAVITIEPLFAVGINGDVRVPGVYDFRPGQTVFDAISRAGGFGADAERTKLLLVRDGRSQTLEASSQDEFAALVATTPLQSGDRLMIGTRRRFSARGLFDVVQAVISVFTLYALISK